MCHIVNFVFTPPSKFKNYNMADVKTFSETKFQTFIDVKILL